MFRSNLVKVRFSGTPSTHEVVSLLPLRLCTVVFSRDVKQMGDCQPCAATNWPSPVLLDAKQLKDGRPCIAASRPGLAFSNRAFFFSVFEVVRIASNYDIPMPQGQGDHQATNLKFDVCRGAVDYVLTIQVSLRPFGLQCPSLSRFSH